MKFKSLIGLVSVALLLVFFSGCVEITEEDVDEETFEPGEIENVGYYIQGLIDNASSGDVINIPSGVYYENIVVDKSISLVGEDWTTTIIDGNDFRDGRGSVISISADNVEVNGFTIRNGLNGISVSGSSCVISDNIFMGNGNLSGYTNKIGIDLDVLPYPYSGIVMTYGSNNTIRDNVFKDNIQAGICLALETTRNDIHGNSFQNNHHGVYVYGDYLGSSNNTIYHNNFLNNTYNAYDSLNSTWDNGAEGNYWSDYVERYSDASQVGNIWNTSYNISGGNNQDRYPLVDMLNYLPVVIYSFTPANPTTQNTIQFSDASYDDGYIESWEWTFGDGTTSDLQNPSHRFVDDGTYNVTLYVTDNLGERVGNSGTIVVSNIEPLASFSYEPSGSPTDLVNISFKDESFDADGEIVSWVWTFGDGNSSTKRNASHKYADDDVYVVTLTVKDDDGASNSISRTITITNAAPTAMFTFTPSNPTIDDTVNFVDSSNDPDGKIVSRSWDFNDGTTSSETSPSHKFNEGRNYKVKLTVVDDDGESSFFTRDIIVEDFSKPSEEGRGWVIILITFVVVFVVLVGVVVWFSRRDNK